MARAQRAANDVGISGILIDILAYRFIADWVYNYMSYFYYDEMTRDFMKYVSERLRMISGEKFMEASSQSYRDNLRSQIEEAYGKVVHTYTAHIVQAKRTQKIQKRLNVG